MDFHLSTQAKRDLDRLPPKDRNAIIVKLQAFAQTGAGDLKKLKGRSEYRLRHGDWRVLFEIENGIIVLRVLHRRNAYD